MSKKTRLKPEISKYFSDLNKRRKNKVGGFKDPKVRAKAEKTRRLRREKSK